VTTAELKPSAFTLRAVVLYHTHATIEDWAGQRRTRNKAKGRRVMTIIARDYLDMSFPEIAELCAWNSHSSAHDAYRLASKDPELVSMARAVYEGVAE
jgi:chromosomal replication initiation ATPase DnaA